MLYRILDLISRFSVVSLIVCWLFSIIYSVLGFFVDRHGLVSLDKFYTWELVSLFSALAIVYLLLHFELLIISSPWVKYMK